MFTLKSKLDERKQANATDTLSLVSVSNRKDDTLNELDYTITDSKKLGSVKITKYKGDTNGDKQSGNDNKLPNATFTLKDSSGNTVKGTAQTKVNHTETNYTNQLLTGLETDANGELLIEGLAWGNGYQLIEDTAPENFEKAQIKPFSINRPPRKLKIG